MGNYVIHFFCTKTLTCYNETSKGDTIMLVNISSPMKRDEIKALLEASENPKFKFVKMKTPMEMQFEVEYAEGTSGDPTSYAKKIIKSQPWGAVLMVRALIEGQAFTGGKV